MSEKVKEKKSIWRPQTEVDTRTEAREQAEKPAVPDLNDPLYQIFRIPKKTGGFRIIEAPREDLKLKQRTALQTLQFTLRVSPFSHAFHFKRSIATMAEHHVGKPYVLAFDLSDFFPSVTEELFRKNIEDHYGAKKGKVKRKRDIEANLGICFHDFQDGKGVRLPQGAPTSPLVANALLYRFDWRCAWFAFGKQVEYSRYADR